MKKIAVLHTGGTFVMKLNEEGQLTPGDYAFRIIETSVFPLFSQISFTQIPIFNLDSSLMKPVHWVEIASRIEQIYYDFDAFVIIHGTDTMAYTASALSFLLENLNKPVVLTGSQLPLESLRSDAFSNLVDSIAVAAHTDLREVVVVFGHKAFRGNRVKKRDVWDFNAFYSPNMSSLVKLGIGIDEKEELFLPWPKHKFKVGKELNENIIVLPFFPGIDFSNMLTMVNQKKIAGIVFEAYGSGNVPSDNPGLLQLFKDAAAIEIPIAVCSQSPHGKVNLHLYEVASQAAFFGLISAADMTREATVAKLMIALGKFKKLKDIKEYMISNIAGEKEDDSNE